jgi:predicted RNA-binding Zn ribbon-like protein
MERTIANLSIDGGCLCFDFINTVHSRREEPGFDYLNSYEDFLVWSKKLGILPEKETVHLRKLSKQDPEMAMKILANIIQTREAMYTIFSEIHSPGRINERAMKRFNAQINRAFNHLELETKSGNMLLTWSTAANMEAPLWRIMKSSYDIWTEEDPARIKSCPNCGFIFLDKTKNNGRYWCNMKTCGSKDKALRYYYRNKRKT